MKISTAAEMRDIDRRAFEEYGIPGLALMQSAGEAFAAACREELGGAVADRRIAMVCGRGNNGGDGFVAARHLANAGADVTVYLAASPDTLRGDAAVYFPALTRMGVPTIVAGDEQAAEPDLSRFDLIGDALLGTGARGAPEGVVARLIRCINRAGSRGVPVVAADIASGVDADTGATAGEAVHAARTVTFGLPKLGLLQYPGATCCGRVTVAGIGIPRALLENPSLRTELIVQETVLRLLPPRVQRRDANKGAFGTVLVIAGSAGMAGAGALSALSALRAGAGLVQLAVPASVIDIAATLAPEVITRALPETHERTHGGPGAIDAALALADKASAVAIGPGMTRNPETAAFVQAFLKRSDQPAIVDADALNAVAESPESVRSRHAPTVLTPHPGEMGRLLGTGTDTVQADRRGAARDAASRYGASVLLKGARTLIGEPDGALRVNRSGSVALATAGSGDVLTGVIGAMLAAGLNASDAAAAGAYLHARAGEIAESDIGAAGVVAGDIRDRLPHARRSLYEDTLEWL